MYFHIAANFENVDGLYKLGDIYRNGIGVDKDIELGLYYFNLALNNIENNEEVDYRDYPSLYFALAKEYFEDGSYETNLRKAYLYLLNAADGYEYQINNGMNFYRESLESVDKLLGSKMFNGIREEFEQLVMENNKEQGGCCGHCHHGE